MVKQAREMVLSGKLGTILKVVVEYPQGYAIAALGSRNEGQISNWRMDPAVAGASNCMGDIGTHAENLARYITDLQTEAVCADLSTFVPGRPLDDDGNVLVRYKGGARGILYASQILNGDENALAIRVYGTRSSLEWHQERAEKLLVRRGTFDETYWICGGFGYFPASVAGYLRVPSGHHEDFFEALAKLHCTMERAIRRARGETR